MKKKYPHLWSSLYGTPLMVLPDKLVLIESVFQAHILGLAETQVKLMEDDGETPEQRAERQFAERCTQYAGIELDRRDDKPYAFTTSGIALIPVMGTLIQRGSWMDSLSGLTSYNQIAAQVDAAENDPDVKGILLEIDSPGGQANGLFELAARIMSAGGTKPLWGQANEVAYSAAYAILAATGRAYAPLTGGVGSIGTLALHVDQSKRDAMQGYTYTTIHAGAKKADMSSHAPLKASAREFIQGEVDRVNDIFVSHVADARNISADAVYAKEAGLMSPPEALDEGFIDGVATLAEVVSLLEAEFRSPGINTGTRPAARVSSAISKQEMTMDPKDKPAAPVNAADPAKHTDAQLDAARTEAHAAGLNAGRAEGIKAEHDRIRGILSHAEAKDRPLLAMSVAFETDMDVERAAKLLAAAPKQAAGSALATLMASVKNPKVGADADIEPGAAQPKLDTASIYASRRRVA